MAIPLVAWLFQGIPESIAMAALIMSLGAERMHWRIITLVGVSQAMIIYIVRWLPLSPFFHVIIGVVTLALLCAKFGEMDVELGYIYSLIAILILMLLESALLFLLNYLHIASYSQVMANVWLRIASGLPQVIGIFSLALLIMRRRKLGRIKIFKIEIEVPRAKKDGIKRSMANFGEL